MDNNYGYNDLSKYDQENDNFPGFSNPNSAHDNNDKEDMELIPHAEIENIRDQLLEIKKTPFRDPEVDKELIRVMNKLDSSINKLISIFEEANQEISSNANQNQDLNERLNEIAEQNSKIAEGVLALADMFKSPELPLSPELAHQDNNFNSQMPSMPMSEKKGIDFTNYDDYSKPSPKQLQDSDPMQMDFSGQDFDASKSGSQFGSGFENDLNQDLNPPFPANDWQDQQQFSTAGKFGSPNIPLRENSFNQIKPMNDQPLEDSFKGFTPPPAPMAQQIEKIPLPPEKKGLLGRFRK